jgi:hypothetical protein
LPAKSHFEANWHAVSRHGTNPNRKSYAFAFTASAEAIARLLGQAAPSPSPCAFFKQRCWRWDSCKPMQTEIHEAAGDARQARGASQGSQPSMRRQMLTSAMYGHGPNHAGTHARSGCGVGTHLDRSNHVGGCDGSRASGLKAAVEPQLPASAYVAAPFMVPSATDNSRKNMHCLFKIVDPPKTETPTKVLRPDFL